ncbi:MAG: adenylyltransferase/cytidyltransferase family protein [archaeon]
MVVLAFGTFDVFHIGHLNYLKQAKKIAGSGELVVIVARDENALKHSHKKLIHDEFERLEIIKNLKIVDHALLGEKNPFDILKKLKPKIIVLGYDQLNDITTLEKEITKLGLDTVIVRAKPYKHEEKKSSIIKRKLLNLN